LDAFNSISRRLEKSYSYVHTSRISPLYQCIGVRLTMQLSIEITLFCLHCHGCLFPDKISSRLVFVEIVYDRMHYCPSLIFLCKCKLVVKFALLSRTSLITFIMPNTWRFLLAPAAGDTAKALHKEFRSSNLPYEDFLRCSWKRNQIGADDSPNTCLNLLIIIYAGRR
jgi:hypothetical protein